MTHLATKVLLLGLVFLAVLPLAALPKAAYLGMSALLPGTGELALGKTNRGAVMLGVDVLDINAYLATGREKNDLTRSYKRYAQVYAGIPDGMPDRYYQRLQDYLSSDDFNQYQELMARNYYLIYTYDPDGYGEYILANTYPDSEAWDWQSVEHQDRYRSLRRRTQTAKMYQSLSLGVILLNRAISLIDVALISRDHSQPTALYFTPLETKGLMLNYRWEF